MSTTPQPTKTVITLDASTSVQLLFQNVETAQKKGVYELDEADLLKKCRDVLLNGVTDNELTPQHARQLLVQAVRKSQRNGGIESLETASVLCKVCQYVMANLSAPVLPLAQQVPQMQPESQPIPEPTPQSTYQQETVDDYDELDELSAPIPLQPKIL